jgi:hypothetical protein
MKLRRPTRRILRGIESLETRKVLAAAIAVVDGDLLISGDASGAIAIVDLGDGTLQVTEAGAGEGGSDLVQTFSDVTDDIRITLDDGEIAANDSISIDLTAGSISVDRVFAALGDGDNSVSIAGEMARDLDIDGGIDNDLINILATASIGRNLNLKLGDGENSLTIDGNIGDDFRYSGKDGNDTVTNVDDTVTIGEEATVAGTTELGLGEQTDRGGRGQHPGRRGHARR